MADWVRKWVKSQVIGPSELLLNMFFDLIIPSMRTSKIQNGHQKASKWPTGSGKWSTPKFLGAPVNFRYEKRSQGTKTGGKKKTSLGAPGALTHRLLNPKRPTGAPKMADGSGKGSNPKLLGALLNFC